MLELTAAGAPASASSPLPLPLPSAVGFCFATRTHKTLVNQLFKQNGAVSLCTVRLTLVLSFAPVHATVAF
eukprot:COSAG06_NODE_6252_length_3012_cov_14.042225_5_plen_71_part_00